MHVLRQRSTYPCEITQPIIQLPAVLYRARTSFHVFTDGFVLQRLNRVVGVYLLLQIADNVMVLGNGHRAQTVG